MADHEGLSSNTLGLFDSAVMSIAGSAPAYSISATTAVLIAAVGVEAPASLLWCGIPMLGVVISFLYLNRWNVDAGASYAWVGKSLNANLGFLAGWALIVSATIFMVSGSFPAGQVTLAILAPKLQNSLLWVTIVGAMWFILIAIVVTIGVRITAQVQWVMSTIEIILLVICGITAMVKFGAHPANAFSWSWFSPTAFKSSSVFVGGALIATFYYWGWDVSANLNEETKNAKSTPGFGALIGIIFVFLMFELFTVSAQMGLSLKEINTAGANILQVMGVKLFGKGLGSIMALAVALSTIATLETTLIQVTRTLFSMGRDGVIARIFGKTHARFKTPVAASVVVGVFAMLLFVLSNFLSSVSTVLTDAINAIGLQVVFYYALAAISVIVYYRRVLFKSVANFFLLFLWPAVAAIFLIVVGAFDVPSLGIVTNSIGIGLILVGIVPLVWMRVKHHPAFYSHKREVFGQDHAVDVGVPPIDLTPLG
ncbi:APC family permease [Alicyclobacillus sp. ALC3]|uniref:APC family permease n=1 Tax=Alicyclobacillus sp. ALC3 TaxID=2796143 RepID=UPI0023789FDF|nr:APC family permease [Alicyclobacillus sp. ALC3]WDL97486.1 APC family permease [Alicyclobacillus sp. ALC3]